MSKNIANKPLILAVETSGRAGSVAIALGGQLLCEAAFTGRMRHSAEVLPTAHGLLNSLGYKPAQIEHIYLSIGPGSFTGLRIATALAKIMHLANSAKLVPVDTLDVIAANASDYIKQKGVEVKRIATILDAKRSQFFIALYQHDTKHQSWQKIFPDSLMTAEQFLKEFAGRGGPIWLLGEGLVYYKDKFKADGIEFIDNSYWFPRAEKVHLLGWQRALAGQFADPITLQPKYLRTPDVKT